MRRHRSAERRGDVTMLDGALTPNDRLDDFGPLGAGALREPDDLVLAGRRLAVSHQRGVSVLDLDDPEGVWSRLPALDEPAGALAVTAEELIVAVDAGLCRLSLSGTRCGGTVSEVGGISLRCVTALTVEPDGSLLAVIGSASLGRDDWQRALMTATRDGSVVRIAPDWSDAAVLASGLGWPAGVLADAAGPVVTESIAHRIIRLAGDRPTTLVGALPAYPWRLTAGPESVWLTFLARRTALVEFVLREDAFREEMIATIDHRWWIAPALRTTGDTWEPLAVGEMRQLGVVKPWAPSRSYGMVARLTPAWELVESLHARAGSCHHGITVAVEDRDRLLAVSRGGHVVLAGALR